MKTINEKILELVAENEIDEIVDLLRDALAENERMNPGGDKFASIFDVWDVYGAGDLSSDLAQTLKTQLSEFLK